MVAHWWAPAHMAYFAVFAWRAPAQRGKSVAWAPAPKAARIGAGVYCRRTESCGCVTIDGAEAKRNKEKGLEFLQKGVFEKTGKVGRKIIHFRHVCLSLCNLMGRDSCFKLL